MGGIGADQHHVAGPIPLDAVTDGAQTAADINKGQFDLWVMMPAEIEALGAVPGHAQAAVGRYAHRLAGGLTAGGNQHATSRSPPAVNSSEEVVQADDAGAIPQRIMRRTETPMTPAPQSELDAHYPLSQAQIDGFRRDGYAKLPQVLSPAVLDRYRPELRRIVADRAGNLPPLESRSTYGKAFQQIINIWRTEPVARELVFAKRLARIAAELMGCRGVRMYHDQALYKEPGGGFTPWHADQFYWPLASEKCVTAWIPLQATPVEMGPLQFAKGSQRCTFGRDLSISDESEQLIARSLKDLPKDETPFALGEVSFHYGWTFHRAGGNQTRVPREVMTVIYMDIDMRLKEPENENQRRDWNNWCTGARVGEIIDGEMNPVLWAAG
jgi:hypothetical protein